MQRLTTADSAPLIADEILGGRGCVLSSFVCQRPALGLASGQGVTVCGLIRIAAGTPNHFLPKLIKKLKVLG